ncbi:MAG: hypothetical protein ACRES1_00955, partial [Steroidobacteraceae bacterium]
MSDPIDGTQTTPPRESPVGRRAGVLLTISGVVVATAFATVAAAMGNNHKDATPSTYGGPTISDVTTAPQTQNTIATTTGSNSALPTTTS